MERLYNFIDGQLLSPHSRKYIENINPATTEIINYIPNSDSRDVEAAIEAAKDAYPKWSKLHFNERAKYLDKVAKEMQKESNFQSLAIAESIDMGKPLNTMLRMDMNASIEQWTMYSKLIECETTPYYEMSDAIGIEHRNCIGIVGLILPWNIPLYILCTKVAAAIVCGNACIIKPSELSPTTAYMMSKIFNKCGIPSGVINIIYGYGSIVGQAIAQHSDIGAISFTGSCMTGMKISSVAAPKLKKLQLELGGKNASIVFNDCYMNETIEGVALSAFLNTGQVCCSGSKIFVQKNISNVFINKLKKYVIENYTKYIGDPMDKNTILGPLVSKMQFDKVKTYLELIKKENGEIILGGKYGKHIGKQIGNKFMNGYWFEPTIVMGLNDDCKCVNEEIFGPICSIHIFEKEDEILRIVNKSNYGLAASIWTSDIRRGQRIARQLEVGRVWINCYLYSDSRMSFGGFKNSGIQRENGRYSIDFFTEIKSIVSKL